MAAIVKVRTVSKDGNFRIITEGGLFKAQKFNGIGWMTIATSTVSISKCQIAADNSRRNIASENQRALKLEWGDYAM